MTVKSNGLPGLGAGLSRIAGAPSTTYRFMSNARDPSGTTAADVSGHGAGMVAQASNTTPFSAEGYFSTVASASGGGTLANAHIIPYNLGTDSFIFSTVLNYTAPGSAVALMGCGDAASARGFYISIRTVSGGLSKARPVFNASGGANAGLSDSTLAFAESTPRDRTLTLAYDAVTNTAYLFRDGRLSDTYASACTFAADHSTPVTTPMCFGSNAPSIASAASKFTNIHLLMFNNRGLPLNVSGLATRLHEQGRVPLADSQIVL